MPICKRESRTLADSPAVPEQRLPASPAAIWIAAIRPKTLTAAIAPVMIGTAFAYADQAVAWLPALAALTGALLIQVGTNLANDYYDFIRGADTSERVGPLRVTSAGLLSPERVKRGMLISFGLAILVGIYLVAVGGWPVVVIGLSSIAAGYVYTGGPYPLAYHGWGDLFVLLFFGIVAVSGTYYVQALTLTPEVLMAGCAPGLLSVAILTVNNVRDIDADRKANKRTLVARFGREFGRMHLLLALLLAHQVPVVLVMLSPDHRWAFLSLASMPLALLIAAQLFRSLDPVTCNRALAWTAQLLLLHSFLFALGWVL